MSLEEYKRQAGIKVPNKHLEHDEQVRLFEWAELVSLKDLRLKLLFAIPNGAYFGGMWKVINKMKAEGLKSGVPDVFLAVPKKRFHGLFIEMKVGKNKPSDTQKEWIENLRLAGYMVEICYSADEAINLIQMYLDAK